MFHKTPKTLSVHNRLKHSAPTFLDRPLSAAAVTQSASTKCQLPAWNAIAALDGNMGLLTERHMKGQNQDNPVADTQRYVALDLEYNQPSGTIIQVGVAIGSASQDQHEFIVRRWNLKVDEPVSEFITQLTGITDADCRTGVSLTQCAQELGALLREQEVFVNPVTWGGGDSVDLLREFSQAQVEFHHFGRRWIDVKTWATLMSLARTHNAKIQHGGLSKAMARYKLQFIGQAHRADVDAFNTLRLFFAILDRQRTLEDCASRMKNL
jgi:DNA polymerase III alpha subunit (gram-positive type)